MTEMLRVSVETPASATVQPFRPFSSLVRVDVSAQSHAGHLRTNNEDQFLVAKLTRSLDTMLTSLPAGSVPERAEETNYLMMVADGMGGHAGGEVASQMAISTLINFGLHVPDWIFKLDEEHAPEAERRAREAVKKVSSAMNERGNRDAELRGMGSTLTGVRSFGRDLLIMHVGDSRAYLLRASQLFRLTRDHTYAQLLVDAGLLAESDVALSGKRHILTNVLGGSREGVEVDIDLLALADGDRILLCSDGLTDMVDDDTIARTLSEAASSDEACRVLLQRALDGGGRDNITVVVAAYALPDEPMAPA